MTRSGYSFKAVVALASAALMASATPASARHGYDQDYRYPDRAERGGYDRYYRGDRYRGYDGNDSYRPARNYRGADRCRDDGVGGAIIGAIAGGLFGSSVAGRGDRTTGAVLGGAIGAVAGHAIDKGDGRNC